MNTILRMPLFPLTTFLLPEGLTRLRIFEPRYVKLVKLASQGQGFVILFKHTANNISTLPWGSWVEIVNFNQGPDGILEIDVKCKSLVEILSIEQDLQQLHFGQVAEIPHWSQDNTALPSEILPEPMVNSLAKVFQSNAILRELYSPIPNKNPKWVIARWLELLPLEQLVKNEFIHDHNFEEAKNFVESILLNSA